MSGLNHELHQPASSAYLNERYWCGFGRMKRVRPSGLFDFPTSDPIIDLPLESLASLAHYGLLRPYLRQRLTVIALSEEFIDEEERLHAWMVFVRDHRLANDEGIERFRIANMYSPEALAFHVEMPVRLRRHCERLYRFKAAERFLERKQHLDRVIYSLLRLQDGGLARELYFQLQDGEATFADLAAQYAEGPERATRGIVGPVPLSQAHPQLADRLRTVPVAQVQEPFLVDPWWVLFRLESLTPAIFDDSMALQMCHELFERWLEQAVDEHLEELRPHLSIPGSHDTQ